MKRSTEIMLWVMYVLFLVSFWYSAAIEFRYRVALRDCVKYEFMDAVVVGNKAYCTMVYNGQSFITPLSHIKELFERLQP